MRRLRLKRTAAAVRNASTGVLRILAAGAADHDPVEKYKVELLTGERNRPEHLTMAESYVRTALEFCGMGN